MGARPNEELPFASGDVVFDSSTGKLAIFLFYKESPIFKEPRAYLQFADSTEAEVEFGFLKQASDSQVQLFLDQVSTHEKRRRRLEAEGFNL
jgi:hypothetical protein